MAVNDNILTLMSQIVLDGHFAPEFLELPRYYLTGSISAAGEKASDAESVPHMALQRDVMTAAINVRQVRSPYVLYL